MTVREAWFAEMITAFLNLDGRGFPLLLTVALTPDDERTLVETQDLREVENVYHFSLNVVGRSVRIIR
jgi:hypothetical protein